MPGEDYMIKVRLRQLRPGLPRGRKQLHEPSGTRRRSKSASSASRPRQLDGLNRTPLPATAAGTICMPLMMIGKFKCR